MSNETSHTKESGSPIVGLLAGGVLMVGGFWSSIQLTNAIDAIHHGEPATGPFASVAPALLKLEEAGIPLDPGKTLAAIGVFLILFPVIKSFFVTPLKQAIDERNSDLERTFSEAEELRAEMLQLRTNYEKQLERTQAEAREQIQSSIREAQNLRQTLMSEATERADQLVAKAHQEIAAERDRVVAQLRAEVTDLALTAAERVIGANMDTEANRRLVDDFINSVEVTR